MLAKIILLINISSGSLLSTLSNKTLEPTNNCMENKHPCLPETINCAEKFYSTSYSLLKSIKELLTIIDQNYASGQGSYKTFPGLQSGALVAKASSYYDLNESPDLARFWTYFNGKYSGWCARIQDANQYFQVGSSFPVVFEKMIISGRYDYNNWISSFKIKYSLDGFNWINYKNSQIFTANLDSKEPVELIFEPFIARSVKILPATWTTNVGGRFEFYLSQIIYSKSLATDTVIRAASSGFKISSSSAYDNGCGVLRAGYDIQNSGLGDRSGGWCAGIMDQNQWIMISSLRNVLWKKIGTMGDSTWQQRVTSYYLMYSVDGSQWTYYKSKQIFQANNDKSTAVEYDLEPFVAVAVRLHPVTWYDKICMRIEVYCIEI